MIVARKDAFVSSFQNATSEADKEIDQPIQDEEIHNFNRTMMRQKSIKKVSINVSQPEEVQKTAEVAPVEVKRMRKGDRQDV